MPDVPLTPEPIDLASPLYAALSGWPFEDEFVARLLADDVPQRVKYQGGVIYVYLDPQKTIVAFGTQSLCRDYAALTDGREHTYIPLLAVHPDHLGRGHGKSVVDHLIGEAACCVRAYPDVLHPALFLDVYEASVAALGLYRKCGFEQLGSGPLIDPLNGKPYRVMARRVAP